MFKVNLGSFIELRTGLFVLVNPKIVLYYEAFDEYITSSK